jgi:hypothetical protein
VRLQEAAAAIADLVKQAAAAMGAAATAAIAKGAANATAHKVKEELLSHDQLHKR